LVKCISMYGWVRYLAENGPFFDQSELSAQEQLQSCRVLIDKLISQLVFILRAVTFSDLAFRR
jgi:hypothetical protein